MQEAGFRIRLCCSVQAFRFLSSQHFNTADMTAQECYPIHMSQSCLALCVISVRFGAAILRRHFATGPRSLEDGAKAMEILCFSPTVICIFRASLH